MNIRIFENNVWLRNVQCTSIGCKNVLLCDDFCVGFIPKIETLIWEDEINPLGNNAEELKDYPDEDCGCNIQHERAEKDCGAR